MFTIEMDMDEVAITILDDSGFYEDFQIFLYDDIVYLKQWDEKMQKFNTIAVSPDMFYALTLSMNKPEGAYVYRPKTTNN